jgi:translation initiation factor 6
VIFVIAKADLFGSPHIGVFCAANDHIALVPKACPKSFEHLLKENLKVEVVRASISNTGLFGIFCVMNNKTLIIPDIVLKDELESIKNHFSEVIVMEDKYTALGNLIAINDHGSIFSTIFDSMNRVMKNTVNIKVGGSDLVGSSVFTTNKAFLANPKSSAKDLEHVEKALKVKGDVGTINFGDPYIKAGLVGNKHGILVGSRSSGPELTRISDVFL